MKKNIVIQFVFIIMAVIVTAVTLFSQSEIKTEKTNINSVSDFSEGWYRTDANEVKHNIDIARLNFKGMNTDRMSIYHSIPLSTDNTQKTIAMRTNNISFSVYLNNEKVYSYGEDISVTSFNKTSGSVWHFINLPQKTKGGIIRIDIRAHFTNNLEGISNIFFDNSELILKHLISYKAVSFFLCILLMIIGFVYILTHILFNKILKMQVRLFYIGLFSLLSAFYSMSQLPILAFFISGTYVLSTFEQLMMLLLPYALLLHIERAYEVPREKLFLSAYALNAVNLFIQALLCSFTSISLYTMRPATQASILYTCIIIFYTLYKNYRDKESEPYEQQNNKLFFICFSLFSLTFTIKAIQFYLAPMYDSSNMFRIGILILVLCCGIISVRQIIEMSKNIAVSDAIRRLAYTDQLTGLSNRASFEAAMDNADSDKNHYNTISIIVFDVNSLKYVNDTFGHQQGDILIQSAANMIQSTFTDGFMTFRIGGDEFAAIYTGDETNLYIDKMIDRFRHSVAENNLNIPAHLRLSVAVGAAFLSTSKSESLADVFRRADRIMYDNKKEMKARRKK